MSQENVERVRETFEAFGRGDLRAALQHVRLEVRTHRIAPLSDPKTYAGPAGMLMAWGDWTGPFEDFELEVGELIDAGDSVVAEIRQRGRYKDSGEPMEGQLWFVCTFYGDEMVQWDMLASKFQAFKGIGRREEPPADTS